MHPEIEQDHPGDCPKCGMALEPKTVAAESDLEDETTPSCANMTRPLLDRRGVDLARVHRGDGASRSRVESCRHGLNGEASRWGQFILSTPVVLWAGWPFLRARRWRSLVNRSLNMFTLIALGVGAAYAFSAVAMFFPQAFPPASGQHVGKAGDLL